jgi:NAD-dependent DNA ligase
MKVDVMRSFEDSKKAHDDKDAAAKAGADALAAKERRIAELTSEKGNIDQAAHEKETELNEKIAQKETALQKANADADAVRKQASENEAKLVAQNNEKEVTIRSMVQRAAPTLTEGPDGEVVIAQDGIAIVNRGKANWLMPGTVFDVLGRAKGGATYNKGKIKVTSCDDESARAAILDEKANDPITRGDLIQSITYSPNVKLHFVLVGDFKKMGKSQAEAVLKRLGAAVDAKVTAETNYVVVGSAPAGAESMDDNESVKAARELGVRMITEDVLSSFCRY